MPPFPNKQTILIVDDEPINIKALEFVLGEEHYLTYATSGKWLLKWLRLIRGRILSSWTSSCPVLSGFEVALNSRKMTGHAIFPWCS